MKLKVKLLGLGILLPLLASCASSAGPPQFAPASPLNSVRATVILLVPYEFESFTYSGRPGAPEFRIPLGRYAVDEMSRQLGHAFDSFVIKPVRSEASARAMLSSNDPGNAEILRFDYAAIPKFMNASSWSRPGRYGYDIDLMLEIYATDGSRVTKIRGRGETDTGTLSGSSPLESARLALSYAVSAIRDEIEGKRNLFIPRGQ